VRSGVGSRGGLALVALSLLVACLVPAAGGSTGSGSVEVVVEVRAGSAPGRVVRAAGGEVDATYRRLASALVSQSELAELEADPAVLDVRAPLRPVPDAVSEGVAAVNAPAWFAASYQGAGVRVAVIDSTFKDATFPVVGNLGCKAPGSSSHGAAVGEIVKEMAPATTVVGYCIENEVDLGNAAALAQQDGARVIVESLSWLNGGPGTAAGAAQDTPQGIAELAHDRGVLWVNSAGNFAQRHWSGGFSDADGDGWTEFAAGDEGNSVTVPGGRTLCGYLKWNDWPTSGQNYNFFLYRQSTTPTSDQVSTGAANPSVTPLAHSTNQQAGDERPTEQLCWTNSSNAAENVFLAIQRVAANRQPRFDLFITAFDLQYQQLAGSLAEPATSPLVLGVGAACWQGNALESYSSRGPTIDGRVKPDLVGPDSVSSPFNEFGGYSECGYSGFRGTSAAAPHVAGAAALVLSRNPGWTPDQVGAYLEQQATNMGPAGADNDSGAGMLHLPDFPPPPPPPQPPPPKLRVLVFQTVPGRSRAGAAFRARAIISVAGDLLTQGRVQCSARVAAAKLRPRSARFRKGFAECLWSVPRGAAGRLLSGSLQVTYKGGTARRTFRQRVRAARA
jgi:Subtilase family